MPGLHDSSNEDDASEPSVMPALTNQEDLQVHCTRQCELNLFPWELKWKGSYKSETLQMRSPIWDLETVRHFHRIFEKHFVTFNSAQIRTLNSTCPIELTID